jgi:molybdopterin synthase sulfur carrier subunit
VTDLVVHSVVAAASADSWDIPTDGTGDSTLGQMAIVRLFAAARDAAGTGRDVLPGDTVGAVLDEARQKYGDRFGAVLGTCKIWVNGEPAGALDAIGSADELAVLPPVSGGATVADVLGGTW